ncbi:MAG: peptide deformylase [Patescibacteria group bacterium]
MTKIVGKNAKVLRGLAKEVTKDDIKTTKIQNIILFMREALDKEDDGVAIAAPQIGKSLRIFVISGKMFRKKEHTTPKDVVFINPSILKKSKETELMDEGCLSVRWFYGLVKRAKKTKIKALNEKGNEFVMEKGGLLSQIFQHETDHLDGVLFTDKAKSLVELPPQNEAKEAEI